VEFQFYLLFPFLVGFMHRYGMRYIVALIGLLISVRFLLWCSVDLKSLKGLTYSTLLGRLDQFLIGMVAGALYSGRGPRWTPAWFKAAWSPFVGIAVAVVTVWIFHRAGGHYRMGDKHWFWIIWTPLEGLAWAFLVLSYCVSRFELPSRISRGLAFLGTLSFSLYVNHWIFVHNMPFHRWLPQLSDNYPMNALLSVLFVVLPLLVTFSCLTYYVIERPFFELRRSYVLKHPDPSAAVQPMSVT
jgi:peptidoglycan/LPS O-acetylase OafA/YrhL